VTNFYSVFGVIFVGSKAINNRQKNSIWQLDRDAKNASSGSTLASTE
jgi:hypothetical protein